MRVRWRCARCFARGEVDLGEIGHLVQEESVRVRIRRAHSLYGNMCDPNHDPAFEYVQEELRGYGEAE